MKVKAEVIGAARKFTRDDELLEWYVESYEKYVREESEEAWDKVRAEEDKKARAEAERVRAEAETALRQAVETRVRDRPTSLAELAQPSTPSLPELAAGFNVRDIMPKFDVPPHDDGAVAAQLLGGRYGTAKQHRLRRSR